MMGFGAPTPPAGGSSGGPAVDETARSLAAAAQAAADEAATLGAAAQASASSALAGSGHDSTARAAASAAQSDADATEALITLRASRMRVYRSASKSLAGTTEELIGTDVVDYATGAFAGQSDASRIVIPAGVSKILVRMSSAPGSNTSGYRLHFARLYNADGTVAEPSLCFTRVNASTVTTAVLLRSESGAVNVTPGQYLCAFVQNNASGGSISAIVPIRESNAMEIEVIE